MQIEKCSAIKLDVLKGALLINKNGAEYRISHFQVYFEDLKSIYVVVYEPDDELSKVSIAWDSIQDWSIQFQT
jgi:hypothetical protein